jgi:hypothetical protein
MKSYDTKQALISLHIPKAGGTSLGDILRQWYGRRFYQHYCDEKNSRAPARVELRPGICIHGHFNARRRFGVTDYYPAAGQFITMLRDPFEIVVSRFFYEKKRASRQESFRDGKPLVLPDDINQYLEQEIQKPDYHPNMLDYMPAEMTRDNFKDIIMAHFVYIGIVEDFAFCMARLAERLGKRLPALQQLNASERNAVADERYRGKFREAHPLECEIYSYVVQHYTEW